MNLSIITINYNNIEGLRKTIDSVLAQKWKDYEWIIIDGGSTDGSKKLIEEVAACPLSQISFWCSERDNGVYNAMNKGIKHSHGYYLNFLNSGDCYHEADTLAQVFNEKVNNADIIYGNYIKVVSENRDFRNQADVIPFSILLKWGYNHQSTFIKSSLFECDLYDENLRIVSDWKLFLKWHLQNKSFKHIDVIVCDFDGTGICNTQRTLMEEEKNIVLQEILAYNIYKDIKELDEYRTFEMYYPEILCIKNLLKERRFNRRILRFTIMFLKVFKRFVGRR